MEIENTFDNHKVETRAVYFSGKKSVSVKKETVSRPPRSIFVESSYIGISHGTEMLFYRGEVPDELTGLELVRGWGAAGGR